MRALRTEPGPARTDAGFSLAEVVVALGLLASVLISVAGLLVVGTRQVYGGRSRSEALALARDVVEEVKSWSFGRTTAAFDDVCDLSAASCTAAATGAAAATWKVHAEDTLRAGRLDILLESLDGAALEDARGIRLTVEIGWDDGDHARDVRLATVRM